MLGSLEYDDVPSFERVSQQYSWADVRLELRDGKEGNRLMKNSSKKKEFLKLVTKQELQLVRTI